MKLLIIGGTAAGTTAAAKAVRTAPGSDITIYEKGNRVSFGSCGLPYYIGGFFDDASRMIARTPEQLEKSGIKVRLQHEVIKVEPDKKSITVRHGEKIFEDTYDKLIISCGSFAVMPPFEDKDLEYIFTLKTLEDGDKIKEALKNKDVIDVVIIGAGFIGLEFADICVELGKNIRIIQLDNHIMPEVFDVDIAEIIEKNITASGIKLHLSESVSGFRGNKRVESVVTNKGEYKADLVLVATGIRPNTKFLEESSIKMDKGAVLTDRCGLTNISDIYSAGDCATVYHKLKSKPVYIPLATIANKMGRIVGENVCGNSVAFEGALSSSCLLIAGLEAAKTGLNEKEASELGLKYKSVFVKDKTPTNYYKGQYDIFTKVIYCAEKGTVLGAQMVGATGAVLRIDVFAVAVHAGLTVSQLGFLDFCYSPPFSRTWDAVNTAANAAK